MAASYAFAFATDSDDDDDETDSKKPEWLKFIYKSLDFGTGKERGARQWIDVTQCFATSHDNIHPTPSKSALRIWNCIEEIIAWSYLLLWTLVQNSSKP